MAKDILGLAAPDQFYIEEALKLLNEYYTNKFLEALPTLDTIISKEYNDGFADAIMKARTAIKQLSKRGE